MKPILWMKPLSEMELLQIQTFFLHVIVSMAIWTSSIDAARNIQWRELHPHHIAGIPFWITLFWYTFNLNSKTCTLKKK